MIHVITGPPCAGKSTYLREHAKEGDLRIDFDVIAQALGSASSHEADGLIKIAAVAARQAAIDEALSRNWLETWIIHAMPSARQLYEYRNANAEIVELDPGRDVCMARAREEGRPQKSFEFIEEWYRRKACGAPPEGSARRGTAENEVRKRIEQRQTDLLKSALRGSGSFYHR